MRSGNIADRAEKSYCTKKIMKLPLRELASSWQPDIALIADMKIVADNTRGRPQL